MSEESADWIIRGGVGGRMVLGSSPGAWPYRWTTSVAGARRWTRAVAERIAATLRAHPEAKNRFLSAATAERVGAMEQK